MGGVRAAAEILNYLRRRTVETSIIESCAKYDAELAQKILDQMFVFDNLLDLDDRGIQLLLREVQSEALIVALKGATEQLREKVFKNMSQRAAEMLKRRPRGQGPGARVRGRGRAEGNPADRAPPRRRGPDRAGRQGRRGLV